MTTTEENKKHFFSLLKEFKFGMYTTQDRHERPRSRPMAIASVEDSGEVWLMADVRSAKVDETAQESHVGITMQEGQKFVSVSGIAEIVRDQTKVQQLWNEAWKVWFPQGKADPNIALIRIDLQQGEYWDNSGLKQITYLYEAAKAYVQGRKPDVSDDSQGKVLL